MSSQAITIPKGEHFFCHDREFYSKFIKMCLLVVFQNVITYSVNMADNLMLGAYSQDALSGAAAINQIQYLLQTIVVNSVGQTIMIIGSQHWGKQDTDYIQKLTGISLIFSLGCGVVLTFFAFAMPESLARIFTNDPAILHEAVSYLSIMRYTYLMFIITNVLIAGLRCAQIVSVAFQLTVVSLFVNVGINYCLIFGHFGCPRLGIIGAAIGTLTARILELIILLIYIAKSKRLPFRFNPRIMFDLDASMLPNYFKVGIPFLISQSLFSISVAMQTAVFGHMSADAIAANSVASTMYQYCKMIPMGVSAATSALIGEAIGTKAWHKLREYVHSFQLIYIGVAIVSGILYVSISNVLINYYDLTPEATALAKEMFVVLTVIIMACSYQSPCLIGIIAGGGDSSFVMKNDIAYAGCFTIPAVLISALVLHLGPIPLVILMNIDQVIKCISNGIKTNRYTWIKAWD